MLDRWSRYAPLVGLIFVALLIVAFAVGGSTPGVHASGAKVISFYKAHHGAQMAANFLSALGVGFLLFFASALRLYLRDVEGARGLAPLGFGGAVLLGVGGVTFASLGWALADARNALTPSAAQALNVLSNDFFWPFAVGLAVYMIGNGLAIARSRGLPHWLGWVAILIGVLGVTPIGFIAFLAMMAWTLILAPLLFLRGTRTATPAPAT